MPYVAIVNDLNKKVSEYGLSLPKFRYLTDGSLHTIDILSTPIYEGHSTDREEILKETSVHFDKFIEQMKLMVTGLEVVKEIISPKKETA